MINNNEIIQNHELKMIMEVERISKNNNLLYYLAYGTVLGAVRHKGFIPWDTDIDIIVDIDNYDFFCETLKKEINSIYEVNYFKYDNEYDSLKARISLRDQAHNTIHIDIFPMCGAPNNKFGKVIFSKIAYINYRGYFVKKVKPDLNYEFDGKKRKIVKFLQIILKFIPANIFIGIHNSLARLFPLSSSKTLYNICGSYGLKEFIPKNWLSEPVYMQFEGKEFPVPQEWDHYLSQLYGDYMTPKKENYL